MSRISPITLSPVSPSQAERIARLLSIFGGSGGAVAVERSGTTYWLHAPAQGGAYNSIKLEYISVGGKYSHHINEADLKLPSFSVGSPGSGIYETGGTFTQTANANCYGGHYRFCATSGSAITYLTPPNTKVVGMRFIAATNTCLATVAIDGDLTRANLLPTAQKLVDAGYYASSILTTNGGTIDPTTRCLDEYYNGTDYDHMAYFATDLTPAAHKVVITNSGYKRAASTDTRMYVTAMIFALSATSIADWSATNTATSVGDPGTGIVEAGGSFSQSSNAGAYGGHYRYCGTPGCTVTYTTPDGSKSVGMRYITHSNGGLATVSIDGNLTLADLLPTAQNLVDLGYYANTILVANGGTLNPTDRCIDFYYAGGPNYDQVTLFTGGLAAGIHTVIVTDTAYKRAASSDTRLYISAMMYGTDALRPLDSVFGMNTLKNMGVTASGYEFAFYVTPTGGTTMTNIGTYHGYDDEQSFVITLDGSTVTLTDGEIKTGTLLTITRTGNLTHPDTGATVIGQYTITYTPDATMGIKLSYSVTWLVGGVSNSSYPAMFPASQEFNFGANAAIDGYSILNYEDNSYRVNAPSRAVYVWDITGIYGVMLYTPNALANTDNWQHIGSGARSFCVQDATTSYNKLYQVRQDGVQVAYAINDVWTGECNYLFVFNPNILALPI